MSDELRELESALESARDFAALKALFGRAEDASRRHASDFDFQVDLAAFKQKLIARGVELRVTAPPAVETQTVAEAVPTSLPQTDAAPEPPPLPSCSLAESEPTPPADSPAAPAVPLEAEPSFESPSASETADEELSIPVLESVTHEPPRKSAIPLWPFAALALLLVVIGIGVYYRSKRPAALTITTDPPGASVTVNGDVRCAGNCNVDLPPGTYQVAATLDGYLPAAPTSVTMAGRAASVAVSLKPVDPAIRILTDLVQPRAFVDTAQPVDIVDGQFLLEHAPIGNHTIRIAGRNGEALLSIEVKAGVAPALTAPVVTRDLFALTLSSFRSNARLSASNGPLPLKMNGKPIGDVGPTPISLGSFQSGVHEIAAGDKLVKESFGAAPTLTAFLKSDVNAGTLIVVTGEDDAKVLLNGVEYQRRTQRGQLRIQTLGPVRVTVSKEGFEPVAAQNVQVNKGQEARVEFTLVPIPKPQPRPVETTRVEPTPAPAPPPPQPVEQPKPVPVERRPEPVKEKAAPAPTPQNGTIADFADAWKADDGGWSHKGGGFLPYKLAPNGTFTFTVKLVRGGSIFRGGRVRWFLNYVDDKNYSLYETDGKTFWANVVVKGTKYERTKTPLNLADNGKSYTIQIDVTPEHNITRLKVGDAWRNLDGWVEPGRDFTKGKFGFLVQGSDEIALADFQFTPR